VQKSLNTVASRIEGLLDHIGRATSYVALAIVGLIVINVTLRYSMSLGTVWAQELEWHLLAHELRIAAW
jgi:TRAP-type mannitol/chloroaromatic compound transport system permease small subunit